MPTVAINAGGPACLFERKFTSAKGCGMSGIAQRSVLLYRLLFPDESVRFHSATGFSLKISGDNASVIGMVKHGLADLSTPWFDYRPALANFSTFRGPLQFGGRGIAYSEKLGISMSIDSDTIFAPRILLMLILAGLLVVTLKVMQRFSSTKRIALLSLLLVIVGDIFSGLLTILFVSVPVGPDLSSRQKLLDFLELKPAVRFDGVGLNSLREVAGAAHVTGPEMRRRFAEILARRPARLISAKDFLHLASDVIVATSMIRSGQFLVPPFPLCNGKIVQFSELPSTFRGFYSSLPERNTPPVSAAVRAMFRNYFARVRRRPVCGSGDAQSDFLELSSIQSLFQLIAVAEAVAAIIFALENLYSLKLSYLRHSYC